jgi:NAD(P)-dependent dehydrogenase (short-subunit alcohol dehydrogenase family)
MDGLPVMVVKQKQEDMSTKIALVTGGSRGLGKDMSIHIAKKGIDVILTYRERAQAAQETVKAVEDTGRKAAAQHLDMNDIRSLDGFIGRVRDLLRNKWNTDKFDFLINNAGMGATVPFEKATEEQFDEFLNVHYKGVYFLTQKSIPLMNAGGRIINISTGTTRYSNPGYSLYAPMKGAVEILTKYLAKELGEKGILANVVAPGPVETDFNNAAIRSNPEVKTRLASLSPLGRVGNPVDDIGPVVAWLCTDEARWINGQRIEASGGYLV